MSVCFVIASAPADLAHANAKIEVFCSVIYARLKSMKPLIYICIYLM